MRDQLEALIMQMYRSNILYSEAVREFNEDLERRTCPGCQTVHPLAYSFWQPDKEDLW